ncbi:mitochondrial import inner membrane translocase subunit Tim8p [Diutina catenulata]
MSSISPTALASLDEQSRTEIKDFLETENQKSKVQSQIHFYNNLCFRKCFGDKPITSGKLDAAEESCLRNCVNVYLDLNVKVVGALQGQY